MHQRALIGAASRYIAGRNAVQTVYWRTSPSAENGKLVKVSKICAFGKPSAQMECPQHIRQDHQLRC